MQPRAQELEFQLVLPQLARLARRGQALRLHRAPTVAQPGGARHPGDHVQVTQTARRFLAVGLQCVGRVLVLGVALAHFQQLGGVEAARVKGSLEAFGKRAIQRRVAGQQARLQQRGLHRDVGGRFAQAVVHRPHAGADFQPRIPAGADESFDARGVLRRHGLARGQAQYVDVGVGEQFAASIPAHRHQRVAGIGQAAAIPQRGEAAVGERRQRRQRPLYLRVRVSAVCAFEQRREDARLLQPVLIPQQTGALRRCRRRDRRGHHGRAVAAGGVALPMPETKSGGARLPAESVSTS